MGNRTCSSTMTFAVFLWHLPYFTRKQGSRGAYGIAVRMLPYLFLRNYLLYILEITAIGFSETTKVINLKPLPLDSAHPKT